MNNEPNMSEDEFLLAVLAGETTVRIDEVVGDQIMQVLTAIPWPDTDNISPELREEAVDEVLSGLVTYLSQQFVKAVKTLRPDLELHSDDFKNLIVANAFMFTRHVSAVDPADQDLSYELCGRMDKTFGTVPEYIDYLLGSPMSYSVGLSEASMYNAYLTGYADEPSYLDAIMNAGSCDDCDCDDCEYAGEDEDDFAPTEGC